MSVVVPGKGLLDLIGSATERIIIAAPYIKLVSLRRILAAVPSSVTELVCVTRWLPEDIASGACDLEIFDELVGKTGSQLLVHPHLHAKYYSDGRHALVGSANLTGRGLGWHTPSNVELLVGLSLDFPGLVEWEAALFQSAVPATEQLRDQIRAQADEIKRSKPMQPNPDVGNEPEQEPVTALWIPRCPTPERLWSVYSGRSSEGSMVRSSYEAARSDLDALGTPQGLTENLFDAYVSGILRHMPILVEIDKLAAIGLTDGRAEEFLSGRFREETEEIAVDQAWRIIKRWLVYFFPEEYRLETGQEVLIKGRELPRR
jgi:hypothetical protein